MQVLCYMHEPISPIAITSEHLQYVRSTLEGSLLTFGVVFYRYRMTSSVTMFYSYQAMGFQEVYT